MVRMCAGLCRGAGLRRAVLRAESGERSTGVRMLCGEVVPPRRLEGEGARESAEGDRARKEEGLVRCRGGGTGRAKGKGWGNKVGFRLGWRGAEELRRTSVPKLANCPRSTWPIVSRW